jgi:hypothetical protein
MGLKMVVVTSIETMWNQTHNKKKILYGDKLPAMTDLETHIFINRDFFSSQEQVIIEKTPNIFHKYQQDHHSTRCY